MNKAIIKQLAIQFAENLKNVLLKYPVEYAICLHVYVILLINYPGFDTLAEQIYLAPAFLCIGYIINKLCVQGIKRFIYYAMFIAYILCQLLIPMEELIEVPAFYITYFYILPIGVLLSGIKYCDRPFTRNVVSIVFAFIVGGFLIQFVSLLLFLIIFSFVLIFGLTSIENDIYFYCFSILSCLISPLVLLAMFEQAKSMHSTKIKLFDNVMNYVFTPAIWIYLLIMYSYLIKIVIQWTLPEGYIASLTFGFMVVAIIARALYQFVQTPTFAKFYNIFSWIILPVLALFWVGVMTRVCEYGFTPQRVYMVLCGIFVTIHTLLFLTKLKIRYTIFSCTIAAGLAIIAYIPYFNAMQISLRSQVSIAQTLAKELKVTNKDNKLDLNLLSTLTNDTTNNKTTLYAAIKYVYRNDSSLAVKEFGVKDLTSITESMPLENHSYTIYFTRDINNKTDISNFRYLIHHVDVFTKDSTLFLEIDNNKVKEKIEINKSDFFKSFLKGIGNDENEFRNNMYKKSDYHEYQPCVVDIDSLSIHMERIRFNGKLDSILDVQVRYVLVK